MNTPVSVSAEIGGKTVTLETGLLALQAAGSVTIQLGETIMFSAVTNGKKPRPGIDYFPLQVEYREKFYAAGRFPGGFFKREARPSEKEILTARLTDRPLRPLFPSTYRNEVQINNMLLSYDGENDSDILSINAASTALTLSELPFCGPVGAVRVGRVDGKFIVNPTHEERENSDLELIYASLRELPIMIEGGGNEIPEEDLVAAMKIAQAETTKLVDLQLELRKKAGLPDRPAFDESKDTTLLEAARDLKGAELGEALLIPEKLKRQDTVSAVEESLQEGLLEKFPEMETEAFRQMFDDLEIETLRNNLLVEGKRVDGRASDEVRDLAGKVSLIPRMHGSALFNRGETQALASVTLGAKSDVQRLDAIAGGATEKYFMLHYNFPPYCVGEAGRLGSTSRREIGHGALAEKSLKEILPDDYPYTIRLVSDIMGSNGSSSMATVCAGTLALMDAGVPIKKPAAGIAIGLVCDENNSTILTDIAGAEDHCGDMDFKVAGTKDGVTGFQVDLKVRGLKWDLVEGAFAAAKKARLEILDYMSTVIAETREEMSPYAPRITQLSIDREKIGELIGPGGKNIRRITEISGAQIDIEDDGSVNVFASNKEAMDIAVAEVNAVSAEIDVGEIYEGEVVNIMAFGAFVQVLPGKDGLVHISELADCHVKSVEDVCKIGDTMRVKCIGVDDRGRVKLSRKAAMEEEND